MKLIIFTIFFISLCITSYPQSSKYSIGGTGGLTFANSTQNNRDEASLGFYAGITSFLKINNYLGMQSEILFLQKNSTYDFQSYFFPDVSNQVNSTTESIEIPILFNGRYPIKDIFFPSLYMGGYLGYILDSEDYFFDYNYFNYSPSYSDFDYGVVAGADFSFLFNNFSVGVDFRYSLGLNTEIETISGGLVFSYNFGSEKSDLNNDDSSTNDDVWK